MPRFVFRPTRPLATIQATFEDQPTREGKRLGNISERIRQDLLRAQTRGAELRAEMLADEVEKKKTYDRGLEMIEEMDFSPNERGIAIQKLTQTIYPDVAAKAQQNVLNTMTALLRTTDVTTPLMDEAIARNFKPATMGSVQAFEDIVRAVHRNNLDYRNRRAGRGPTAAQIDNETLNLYNQYRTKALSSGLLSPEEAAALKTGRIDERGIAVLTKYEDQLGFDKVGILQGGLGSAGERLFSIEDLTNTIKRQTQTQATVSADKRAVEQVNRVILANRDAMSEDIVESVKSQVENIDYIDSPGFLKGGEVYQSWDEKIRSIYKDSALMERLRKENPELALNIERYIAIQNVDGAKLLELTPGIETNLPEQTSGKKKLY